MLAVYSETNAGLRSPHSRQVCPVEDAPKMHQVVQVQHKETSASNNGVSQKRQAQSKMAMVSPMEPPLHAAVVLLVWLPIQAAPVTAWCSSSSQVDRIVRELVGSAVELPTHHIKCASQVQTPACQGCNASVHAMCCVQHYDRQHTPRRELAHTKHTAHRRCASTSSRHRACHHNSRVSPCMHAYGLT